MAISDKNNILEPNFEVLASLPFAKHAQWVLWEAVKTEKGFTKVPKTVSGYSASTKKPNTWGTFEDVRKAYASNSFSGIGFVLTDEHTFTCIDIDDIENTDDDVKALIDELKTTTYCELSPSGTGLHAWFIGSVPEAVKGRIEIYPNKRYMTMTGHSIGADEISDDQELLTSIYERFKPLHDVAKLDTGLPDDFDEQLSREVHDLEKRDVLQAIKRSSKADKFNRLYYEADFSDYPSQSEADAALMSILAFYTQKDVALMDALFRDSGLYRDKYDKRRGSSTYGIDTIKKALDFTENVYNPNYHGWREELSRNEKTGAVKPTFKNTDLILQHDENLQRLIRRNLFDDNLEVSRVPFWRHKHNNSLYWTDTDSAELIKYLELDYGLRLSQERLATMLRTEAEKNAFHPVKNFIEAVEWDGVERIETLFIDYLGADDTHYTRAVTRKWLIAAVARIYEPGRKFDNMIVLHGTQGIGKSTIVQRLSGRWFNESINHFRGNEAVLSIQGSWICEVAELSAMSKSSIDEIKAFLSTTVDRVRKPYDRLPSVLLRQSVFIGTTNDDEFLKDRTGNRRFWPVGTSKDKATKNVFTELTSTEVGQIWAEAKRAYDNGEALLLDEEAEKDARRIQEEHTENDSLVGEIEDFLLKDIPPNYWDLSDYDKAEAINKELFEHSDKNYVKREKTCALEIYRVLQRNQGSPKQHEIRKINQALNSIPYLQKSTQLRFGSYGRQRGYKII
ncbi:hypothetical protein GJU84_11195 [Staphylococcus chromogenes]|uniref:phage NrS-1 polymerase family protein n=1 Tax=Staphylococcus chromogenes TaxID=46126 RepID=UPI001404B2A9|nr:VapE domain-containing protein [Staphylococcus chromogenes]QIN27577.1 hypothetical protein GJU84_11195 [Staphylococcus chromogenes]